MKKYIITGLVSLLVLMLAGSCSDKNIPLENTQWKLTEMNGENNPAFAEDGFFMLMFSEKGENRISGKGGCNNFFGTYENPEPGKISFKVGGATMMAGPNMEYDQIFFSMLENTDSYKASENELTLNAKGTVVAKFKRYTPSQE